MQIRIHLHHIPHFNILTIPSLRQIAINPPCPTQVPCAEKCRIVVLLALALKPEKPPLAGARKLEYKHPAVGWFAGFLVGLKGGFAGKDY